MKAVFTAEGRVNTKQKRKQDCKKAIASAPQAYVTNSTKEELCYEYVNSFIEQFMALYPKRRRPYMLTENEYGVKKFVCTTLRQTLLPFQELYDMYECASFLAGYILYEALDPQTEPPSTLFSPTRTLDSYTGDSYDMATVLCSFLLGAGYDAYVVHGYAPRYITLRDQSKTICPLISVSNGAAESSTSNPSAKGSVTGGRTAEEPSLFEPPDRSVKNSAYVRAQEEKQRDAEFDSFVLWLPDESDSSTAEDDSHIERCHAWVMVCAGRKDVVETTFLEPSTGRAYTATNCPYLGVESVWNATNYWVNLHPTQKISEVRAVFLILFF